MSGLALQIPPVVVVIAMMILMWLCNRWIPAAHFEFTGQQGVLIFITVVAMVLCLSAMASFRKHQTTVNPVDPDQASSLITSGVFKYSRNPIYLGFALVLVVWGLRLSNAAAFVGVPIFIAYMTQWQIKPEERILLKKFGAPFADYMQRVRRWI